MWDATGRHFDDLPAHAHMHDLKTPTYNACAAKQPLYLLWPGLGGDIKVFRVTAQQQVAYTAAYQIGGKAGLLQLPHDPQGAGADVFSRDRKSRRLNSSHVANSYAVLC